MEEAVIERLLDDVGVSALVSARVYAGLRPQASELPSVVFSLVDGAPVYVDEGETGLLQARFQVDCWGETYASAKYVARAVKESLSAYHGTINSVEFQNLLLDGERDLNETGSNVPEYPFRTSLDFMAIYKE